MNIETYNAYIRIMHRELVPAFGCTEPIAIALAGAVMRKALVKMPDHIIVRCSGNIIKNAKSVVVPGSGGMKGIETAAVLGTLCGVPEKDLEVLCDSNDEDRINAKLLLEQDICDVELLESADKLHVIVRGIIGKNFAEVEIRHTHNGIVRIETSDGISFIKDDAVQGDTAEGDFELMNIKGIYEFASEVAIDDIEKMISRQIEYNTSIANEGIINSYGSNVGKTLLAIYGSNVETRARALAAAGSDARMSGCEMPVIINAGSGNQGLTVSLPVIVYAKELKVSKEVTYRALVLSNLISIYQKSRIGRLSAYCGAVSAAAGAGAGITFLHNGSLKQVGDTVVNIIANLSGVVCDGAKPSCAAKISSSVDAAILGHKLAMDDSGFLPNDGLVKSTPDKTIEGIGRMARDGMELTDRIILETMLENE